MDQRYTAKVSPAGVLSDQGAMVAHVECAQCGAHDRWRMTSVPEPAVIHRHFTRRGWQIKRKAICPQCKSKTKKEAKPMVSTAKPIPQPAQVPNPELRERRREAHDLIAMSFNIGKGQYEEGYSDQRIAKETSMPEAWVRQRREEEFGPIKQPDEIAELRQQLASLTAMAADVSTRLDKIVAKNGWAH